MYGQREGMSNPGIAILHQVKDMQFFLGFANFYRRFIYNYSKIVIPLTWLTRKNMLWVWSENCQQAFITLKIAFTLVLVLIYWDLNAPIVIETDTSNYILAAIISIQVDTKVHLIVFHLRMFSAAELNYDIYDKKLLAIYETFCKWGYYLKETTFPVKILINYKNLVYFNIAIQFWLEHLGTKLDTLT